MHFNLHYVRKIISVRWHPCWTHLWSLSSKFSIAFSNTFSGIAATSWRMESFSPWLVRGLLVYTVALRYPHKNKSQTDRSGERGGQKTSPKWEITCWGNMCRTTSVYLRCANSPSASCWTVIILQGLNCNSSCRMRCSEWRDIPKANAWRLAERVGLATIAFFTVSTFFGVRNERGRPDGLLFMIDSVVLYASTYLNIVLRSGTVPRLSSTLNIELSTEKTLDSNYGTTESLFLKKCSTTNIRFSTFQPLLKWPLPSSLHITHM